MQDLVFCGDNRRDALSRLIALWQQVAASARDGTPCLRIAVIEAERGLGKTRLAQELYRQSARDMNPGGYWPADPGRHGDITAVMPGVDGCHFAVPPPFLWWGLAVADGPNPGNTVFNGLDALLPHLAAARIAGQTGRTDRALMSEALALAADLGIEVADATLQTALGLGLLKTLGTSLLRIGRLVRDRGAPDTVDMPGDQVMDRLLDDLDLLLSPRARAFAGIPMAILIDDAQFADRDPALPGFLERLLHRAAAGGWPLLVILTHWSRQFRDWTDGAGQSHPPSHVAQVLEHARWGAGDHGRFAATPGGVLDRDAILRLDLGAPVDDLRPALAAACPGLSAENAARILERAGGNPRKLEQILAFMLENPWIFEDYHESRDLTPDGIDEILRLSNLEIDRIVERRFHDTPADVRSALALASAFGSRFAIDLVDRLAQGHLGASAEPGLMAGEETYRFLRDVAVRAERAPAFAERLFADAAASYRRRGNARRHLPDFPDEARLAAAVTALLAAFVADPAAFPALTPAETALALGLAADRLEGGERALALARLAHFEDARGDAVSALAAATRFAEAPVRDLPAALADRLGAVLWRAGAEDAATAIWSDALAALRADPGDRAALARALGRIGDVAAARGDAAEAVTRHAEAVAIWKRLSDAAPDRPDLRLELASATFRSGLARAGGPIEGEFAARALIEMADLPEDILTGFFLALALEYAGRAYLEADDPSGATEHFADARAALAELEPRGFQTIGQLLAQVACGHARALTPKDWPAAQAQFATARAGVERILDHDPGSVAARMLRADIDLQEGRAGLDRGPPETAIAQMRRGASELADLLTRLPGRNALAEALSRAETALADAGDDPAARLSRVLAQGPAGLAPLRHSGHLRQRLALWQTAGQVQEIITDMFEPGSHPAVTWPLPPPFAGRWVTLNPVKRELLKQRLEALLPWLFEGRALKAIRCTLPECFPGRVVCDLLFEDADGPVMAAVIYGAGGARLMTGSAADLFAEVERGLMLDTRPAGVDYLRIFCAFTLGESGGFDVIEDPARIDLPAAQRADLAPRLVPPQVVNWTEDVTGWVVRAVLAHGGGLFSADFRVVETGEVEMTDDDPLAEATPLPAIRRDGPFRRSPR